MVAIRWAESRAPSKVLVVCPSYVGETWRNELRKEGIRHVGMLVGPHTDKERGQALASSHLRWYVVNYEQLRTHPRLAQLPWDAVIVDESTRIRNPKAKITQVACSSFRHVARRAILSGCPNPESDLDFFCQMVFLYDGFMGSTNFWEWRQANFHQGYTQWQWNPNRGTSEKIKKIIHKRCSVLTRRKAGMRERWVREVRYVDLPKKIRKVYNKTEREWVLGQAETKYAVVKSTWLAKLAGGCACPKEYRHSAKTNALIEIVQGELAKEQAIVWFRFNDELRECYRRLRKAKISCETMIGGETQRRREAKRKRFTRGSFRLFLVQAKCAMFGLDLSVSDTAIYFSRWFDGEVNAQTRDRIVHPQKKTTLLVVDLVTRDTTDEDVLSAVKSKQFTQRIFTSNLFKALKRRRKRWNATQEIQRQS